jgi:UDP-N-acetylmuramoyl-tripeptide--D-alanyl-D-alanine ligase
LWDALSTGKRAATREKRGWIRIAQAVAAKGAGEVMMIKGSLGSTMKTIVNALEGRFPGKAAREKAAA